MDIKSLRAAAIVAAGTVIATLATCNPSAAQKAGAADFDKFTTALDAALAKAQKDWRSIYNHNGRQDTAVITHSIDGVECTAGYEIDEEMAEGNIYFVDCTVGKERVRLNSAGSLFITDVKETGAGSWYTISADGQLTLSRADVESQSDKARAAMALAALTPSLTKTQEIIGAYAPCKKPNPLLMGVGINWCVR